MGHKCLNQIANIPHEFYDKTFAVFEEHGMPIKLANTYMMRIISDTDIKTDPIDARKIANIFRASMISRCYVAPPVLRDARELLRYRIGTVYTNDEKLVQYSLITARSGNTIHSTYIDYIATLEKICNGFWILENVRFTVNVDTRILQKV